VTPDVENLVESTSSPVLVILPNSSAPLAQTATGPVGSQVDAGITGRGGGGDGSLLMGANPLPAAVGSSG
jgi:hypothetical protein